MVAGETVKGFFGVMKDQPVVLSLCVMNFALIGLLYYQSSLFNTQRQENVKLFLQVQGEVQKLLSQCIVPPSSSRTNTLLDLPPYKEAGAP